MRKEDNSKLKQKYLYLISAESENTKYYKIGITEDVDRRFWQIYTNLPPVFSKVMLEHYIPTHNIPKAEEFIFEKFKVRRIKGEWFFLTDENVTWFKGITADDLYDLIYYGE